MIKRKWWEKKAIEGSHQWCVIRVEEGTYIPETWGINLKFVFKPCHLSNLPANSTLMNRDLTKHEAQALCKLLNLQGVES